MLRIAPATELSVLNLDDHVAQVRLTQGTVSVRVRAVDPGDTLEIDTPAGAVSLLQPGLYRLDVNEAGDSTIITVRQGEADMANGTTDVMVTGSQSAIVSLDSAQPDVKPAVRIDEFEDWCLARDRRTDNVQATRYVSAATIGYEDLDANGSWQTVPQDGAVWVPRVRGEWAPYRFGRWAWVEPWGWTWIDDEPWGFAPFHYGRWAFLPSRGWAWVPGAVVARPVYAPALVAFVGGPNWAVSARAGAPIGWFPLGPREVYVPAYRATAIYTQRINAAPAATVNVTSVTYVNRTVPGAVTAVSRETFVRSQPVARATVVVSREQIQSAPIVSGTVVAPERVSVTGTAVARVQPPAPVVSRQVMVRSAPPPLPTPFVARPVGAPADRVTTETAPTPDAARTQAAARNPLVRSVVPPRNERARPNTVRPTAAPNATPAPTAASPHPVPPASATPAPQTPPPAPTATPSASNPRSIPQAAPAPVAAAPIKPTPPPPNAQLNARLVQERADIQARHQQERAALQARHKQERQQAHDPNQRAEVQHRQQEEMKALVEKQRQEHEALLKRQQEERKGKGN